MSLPFKTLPEFLDMRDGNKIVLSDFYVLLHDLNYKKLVALLTRNTFIRLIRIQKWIKEVSRLCGIKIKLKVSLTAHRPYMLESGKICLSYKDLCGMNYSFLAIAHETAHFILMCDEDYEQLKALDRQYPLDAKDRDWLSPLEYCANSIMLMLLEECIAIAQKNEDKEKFSQFKASLSKSIFKC